MQAQVIQYLLPDDLDLPGLEAHLRERHRFLEDPPSRQEQRFLDSFDWRIWQAGGELMYEQRAQLGRLCWLPRKGDRLAECVELPEPPRNAEPLPAGELRERIAGALQMRVLLPLVVVRQQCRTLRLLNEDDKTVLRLLLQDNQFASPDGRRKGELEGRLELIPLKGYHKPLQQLRTELDRLGLKSVRESLFESALIGIGRHPMDYSSKLNYRLDPEARSDVTAKHILLSLLDTLEANVEGAKADLDSEFLHDLRVASRRSRSAMSQIKGVFDPRELEPFRKGFAWIGQITGPTRDMDVYLLKYPAYRDSLPQRLRSDLTPFHEFLHRQHQQAQQAMVRKLNSPHFRKLIKSWRQWLEEPVPKISFQPNALQPISRLADRRIHKIYKRVLKDGRLVKPDSPPERLHELRKDCKKLRYLMEFFQSLYPKPQIRELIKRLKALLDNLGDFQDFQVQATAIGHFGEQMLQEGASVATLIAMGALVGDLLKQQDKARQEFAELFAQFDSKQNRQAFEGLFGGS